MTTLSLVSAIYDPHREEHFVATMNRSAEAVQIVRRCVDIADLLAVANTHIVHAAVVSIDFRKLDRIIVKQLYAARLAVVALLPNENDYRVELDRLGISHSVTIDADPAEVAKVARDAVDALVSTPVHPAFAAHLPVTSTDHIGDFAGANSDQLGMDRGKVIAVWGPTGAPGRTTVATGIAAILGRTQPVFVMDADVYGGSIAQLWGVFDESPGIAAAVRVFNQGNLTSEVLAQLTRSYSPTVQVLTGINRAQRWAELHPDAVTAIVDLAAVHNPWVVVDCGFSLEQDEEITFDMSVPRRNGVTVSLLSRADIVVVVGSGDPVGTQRLVHSLLELVDTVPTVTPIVVINKVRSTAIAGNPKQEIGQAIFRFSGHQVSHWLPYDGRSADTAITHCRSVVDDNETSDLALAIKDLAMNISGEVRHPPRQRTKFLSWWGTVKS